MAGEIFFHYYHAIPFEGRTKSPIYHSVDYFVLFFCKILRPKRVDPYGATMAFAKGAKMYGTKIYEGSIVTGVSSARNVTSASPSVTGVILENGHVIEANSVVNCAGMWARQFGMNQCLLPSFTIFMKILMRASPFNHC